MTDLPTNKGRYQFLIQTGKDRGSYSTKYSFTKDTIIPTGQVALYYFGINTDTSRGFKKRLVRIDTLKGSRVVVDRVL